MIDTKIEQRDPTPEYPYLASGLHDWHGYHFLVLEGDQGIILGSQNPLNLGKTVPIGLASLRRLQTGDSFILTQR